MIVAEAELPPFLIDAIAEMLSEAGVDRPEEWAAWSAVRRTGQAVVLQPGEVALVFRHEGPRERPE